VDGDIASPRVAIAEGAHFRGSVDMQRQGAAKTQQPQQQAKPATPPQQPNQPSQQQNAQHQQQGQRVGA
jgi:cytoskeletal protein CcmA (bactofilin family)